MSNKTFFLTFLVLFSHANGNGYNTQTFYITPHTSRFINRDIDTSYFVLNVGKSDIDAKIKYGNEFKWYGNLQQVRLRHGESYLFKNLEEWPCMGLEIYSFGPEHSFVHGFAVNEGFSDFDDANYDYFNIDSNELLKTIVATSMAYVPIAGEALASITEFFWPEDEEDVWDQVEDKVEKLIDTKTQEVIDGILKGLLNKYKKRIKLCTYEINHPNITDTANHYMNIAEDLIGLEKRFVFDSNNVNFFLLPLYTAVINLKITYYQYGIKDWEKIGLNSNHTNRLKYYIYDVVYDDHLGPIRHVHKVCEERLKYVYQSTYTEDIFDNYASSREFCAINGFEHLPVWKKLTTNPYITKKPDIPYVAYSTQFGRKTALQSCEMIYPHYAPPIVNGKLIIPTELTVFLTSQNKIGGLQIAHNNGKNFHTGPTRSGQHKKINFNGTKLIGMTARGTGQIDALEFAFDDGRVVKTGTPRGDARTFSLDKHHIVGFFMTGSVKIDPSQAANIAVTFQLIT